MASLIEKIILVHRALRKKKLDHAFGGALALAWCTEQARGTIDIDVNIFVDTKKSEAVFEALPTEVTWQEQDLTVLIRDGQVRVWFEDSPLDIFLNTTDYHDQLGFRTHHAPLGGETLPFLSCLDLAVFKAFFNRTKDWADLEAMAEAGSLDVDEVTRIIRHYLGEDERQPKLDQLRAFQK